MGWWGGDATVVVVVVAVVLLSVLGQLRGQRRGGLRVHIHEDGSIASNEQ